MSILSHDDDSRDDEINMTPMIDCVFLLLIFFLCTASLKKPQKVLPIEIPAAAHAKDQRLQDEVVISITAEGERYVADGASYHNQAPLGRGELMEYLRDLAAKGATTAIRVDIDRRTPYAHVMEVMDTLELYGLRRVFLRSRSGFADEGP